MNVSRSSLLQLTATTFLQDIQYEARFDQKHNPLALTPIQYAEQAK